MVFKVSGRNYDKREESTYHLFSEKVLVGTYIDAGIGEIYIPRTGPAVFKLSGDKGIPRTHPLFKARESVRRANMDGSRLKDERFFYL